MRAAVAIVASVLTVTVLLTATTSGSVWRTRCGHLTGGINLYRTQPDVRLMRLLCKVGRDRARTMADAKSIWHNLKPVRRALRRAGICWTNVGEVLASNDWSGSAGAFIEQWRWSPPHWDLLMDSGWQRGGGSWVNRGTRHVAVFYMLAVCEA